MTDQEAILARENAELKERIETLERSLAEQSMKTESLESSVRSLQNTYHVLQRGLKILLSESTPCPPPSPPTPKAAIQDLS